MPNEWQSVLDEIQDNVSETAFKTYFGKVKFDKIDDTIQIIVPSVFIKKQYEGKYKTAILDALKAAKISYKNLEIVESKEPTKKGPIRGNVTVPEKPRPISTAPVVKKNLNTSKTGLKPEYTLDNYVVGKNNDLAVSAAKAVIDNPGKRYNPYFIYGSSGSGKTHLIQAIGNAIHEKYPEKKVRYVTTEEFYNDFVNSIQKKLDGFKEKYRKVDVLIVDDFQGIVGKDKSQEEFFHTFNDLYKEDKQIIVSSDRLPNQIATVDPRLSSRLMMGLPVDIQMPGFEERCAIIKMKAELLGADLDNQSVEKLAELVSTNIRDLEGALHRVLAMAELRGVPTIEVIEDLTGLPQDGNKRHLSPKQVIERVAKYYSLTTKDLLGTSRLKDIKNARQVAMYLLNEELGLSTVKIGQEFKKDHTTIMHGIKMVNKNLKSDFSFREQISELKAKIYAN